MSVVLRGILAIASLFFLLYVTNNVRKGKLLLSHSLLWMFLSILGFCCALLPEGVVLLSSFFGFQEASNFVFFILVGFAFVYLFYLSMQSSKQEKKTKGLIQELALDRHDRAAS